MKKIVYGSVSIVSNKLILYIAPSTAMTRCFKASITISLHDNISSKIDGTHL